VRSPENTYQKDREKGRRADKSEKKENEISKLQNPGRGMKEFVTRPWVGSKKTRSASAFVDGTNGGGKTSNTAKQWSS